MEMNPSPSGSSESDDPQARRALPGSGVSMQPLTCNPFRIKEINGQLHYLPAPGAPSILLPTHDVRLVGEGDSSPDSRALDNDPPPPRRMA